MASWISTLWLIGPDHPGSTSVRQRLGRRAGGGAFKKALKWIQIHPRCTGSQRAQRARGGGGLCDLYHSPFCRHLICCWNSVLCIFFKQNQGWVQKWNQSASQGSVQLWFSKSTKGTRSMMPPHSPDKNYGRQKFGKNLPDSAFFPVIFVCTGYHIFFVSDQRLKLCFCNAIRTSSGPIKQKNTMFQTPMARSTGDSDEFPEKILKIYE